MATRGFSAGGNCASFYLQLRIVLPAIEPIAWLWVAPVAAGFVPLLLAFIGYTQGLLAGRIESEVTVNVTAASERQQARRVPTLAVTTSGDDGHEDSSAFSDNGQRSFAEFERAMTGGELDVSEMTGGQIGQWAGKSAATGHRWKRLVGSGLPERGR